MLAVQGVVFFLGGGGGCLTGIEPGRGTNSPQHCQSETESHVLPKRNEPAVEGTISGRSAAQPPSAALYGGSAAVSPPSVLSPDRECLLVLVREACGNPTFPANLRWVATACQGIALPCSLTLPPHQLGLFFLCFQLQRQLLDLVLQESVLTFGVPGRRSNLSTFGAGQDS